MRLLIVLITFGTVLAIENPGIANESMIPMPKSDIVLARADAQGNVLWAKNYSHGHYSTLTMAITTRAGGYALLASWADSCIGNGHKGVWMLVTDGEGNILWDRCYDPTTTVRNVSLVQSVGIIQLPDGRYIMAGKKFGPDPAWILCLSESGEELWFQTYGMGDCRALMAAPDGGFLLVWTGDRIPRQAPKGAWLCKTDSLGNQQWLKEFECGYTDYIYDAAVAQDGRIAIVGQAYAENHPDRIDSDGWVVITDSEGKLIRSQVYGRTIGMKFLKVWVEPGGGFLLSGEQRDKMAPWVNHDDLLMRITENGDSLWSRKQKDGWEEGNSGATAGDRLPRGYLDQISLARTPQSVIGSKHDQTVRAIQDSFVSRGWTGRMDGNLAQCSGGGLYFAGSIMKTRFDRTK
jgi:hypothetical protein